MHSFLLYYPSILGAVPIYAVVVRIDFDQQVSYLAVDAIFPEWKIWTQFLDETASGMKLDALSESHPIEVPTNIISWSMILLS
jgi:hypothetical protein